jgi:A/G-specific adenine glycosylase
VSEQRSRTIRAGAGRTRTSEIRIASKVNRSLRPTRRPVLRSTDTRMPSLKADRMKAAKIARQLETWFDRAGRTFIWRGWRDQYRSAVTEILLQRTRADSVAKFLGRFLERYPSWASLQAADFADLSTDLSSLGLQRRRAGGLKALAEFVLQGGEFGEAAPGVGQYVSRAVSVTLDGSRLALVDSNFTRVVHRLLGGQWKADYRFDLRLQEFAHSIVMEAQDSRSVNWAMLDLGALICRPSRPLCPECPLLDQCVTGQNDGVV